MNTLDRLEQLERIAKDYSAAVKVLREAATEASRMLEVVKAPDAQLVQVLALIPAVVAMLFIAVAPAAQADSNYAAWQLQGKIPGGEA